MEEVKNSFQKDLIVHHAGKEFAPSILNALI
jgi:hypothetical protein